MMAEAHQQLQRPQQLLAIINNDFTLSQTFQDDPSKGGVLQFPHPITFGFPLPSRGAVVYGPDGKPVRARAPVRGLLPSSLAHLVLSSRAVVLAQDHRIIGRQHSDCHAGALQHGGQVDCCVR